MSPIRAPQPRKLVLARETVRTLAGPRNNTTVEATLDGRATSCGVDCGCTGFIQAR
ncbi:MAG: hypothetical protein AB1941_17430 [Gemmatimonadota bacterium]